MGWDACLEWVDLIRRAPHLGARAISSDFHSAEDLDVQQNLRGGGEEKCMSPSSIIRRRT